MGVLDGQVAAITGCGRLKGLGRSIALSLANQGADIAVGDLVPGGSRNLLDSGDAEAEAGWKGLPSLVDEIAALGRRALPLVGDVSSSIDVDRMVGETLTHFGRIDILVNNAGAPHGRDRDWTWNVPEEAFDLVMRINTKGVFLMSAAVARHMLQRGGTGRIVNISSNAGRVGMPKRGAYCASKFAVIGLTQVMAAELAPHGVTVNAICPGWIDTPRFASTTAKAAKGEDVVNPSAGTPVGRIGTPEDVAAAVAYLVSPAASYVTGQSLGVDGGVLMR
jgi:NAD(P)-dependent dehydrogenase (short-subunit alcohol dehydrogenase family)